MFKNLVLLVCLSVASLSAQEFCPDGTWRIFGLKCDAKSTAEQVPEDFVRVFGERPKASKVVDGKRVSNIGPDKEFDSYRDYRAAVVGWEQQLKEWKENGGAQFPKKFTEEQVAAVVPMFVEYNMGEPVFFKVSQRVDKIAWVARFPDAKHRVSIEFPADLVVLFPGHTVALYQVQLLQDGVLPEKCHPFNARLCRVKDGHALMNMIPPPPTRDVRVEQIASGVYEIFPLQ